MQWRVAVRVPHRLRPAAPAPPQILAFSNLNPGSVAAARALVPKLDGFSDEEITEVLVLLRRASARSQAGIADLLGAQG